MSILDSMLKSIEETEKNRPKLTEEEKRKIQLEKEKANKVTNQLSAYRVKVEGHFKKFLSSKSTPTLRYPPMENKYRLIVHEVGEKYGCISHSFGHDGIDRFVMAWRPEAPPSILEVQELQRKYDGEDMFDTNPDAGGESQPDGGGDNGGEDYSEEREQPVEDLYLKKRKFKLDDEPDKLMVLGATKRDLRTIEEIQQDIKEAKKQKITHRNSNEKPTFAKPTALIKKEIKEKLDGSEKQEAEKFLSELNNREINGDSESSKSSNKTKTS
eukprot:TRINITY_DN3184_c0_g1_i1.p1 TRINITY_DN3184_c0_g1~~TRINITY_DN3184_c0_g1_i1.p1  ORF type:complete len:270 (+),score=38.91 TRINITY_DN3184_c0_g1_i1:68-877(+)